MGKIRRGRRLRGDIEKVPPAPQTVPEAVNILKGFTKTKFDQTIELVCHMGIDPKQAEQALRGSVSLPNGIGATKRVIAFCDGKDIAKAKAAGAIEAGADDLIKKVQDGWMDFDVAIATPGMMRTVSRLGRVLGPQGKMPSPKTGQVTADVTAAVREFAAGKVEFRNDTGGNIQVPVGKMSFDAAKLVENVEAFLGHLRRLKPSTAKGAYFKKVVLAASMTPAVILDVN